MIFNREFQTWILTEKVESRCFQMSKVPRSLSPCIFARKVGRGRWNWSSKTRGPNKTEEMVFRKQRFRARRMLRGISRVKRQEGLSSGHKAEPLLELPPPFPIGVGTCWPWGRSIGAWQQWQNRKGVGQLSEVTRENCMVLVGVGKFS